MERAERFIWKTRYTTPQQLREPWKGAVIYTLVQYFGWELKDAAAYVGVSRKTARRDWDEARASYSMAELITKQSYNGALFIYNLRDYIYYNMYRK